MRLGQVEVVIASQDTVKTYRMAEAEYGGIQVDDAPAQLVVDICFAGGIPHVKGSLCRTQIFTVAGFTVDGNKGLVECLVIHGPEGLVLFRLSADDGFQAPVGLIFKADLLPVIGHHLIGLGPFHGYEDVVLVGLHETVVR